MSQPKMKGLGFHVGRGNDMLDRIDNMRQRGFLNFQIFINSPRQMLSKPGSRTLKILDSIGEYVKKHGVNIFIHAPYTINLSNKYNKGAYWNIALKQELELAEQIGAKAVVVHTGRFKEQSRDVGIANMVANISFAIETSRSSVKLLLETPAGQGTELGVEIEELAYIWKEIPIQIRKRMGICVDTCHIYAAGYDIRSRTAVRDWMLKFNRLIGLENLGLVHLNDSREPLNSHLDRHAYLGKGMIGDKLGIFVREMHRRDIPIVVETPGDFESDCKILDRWI